jgi:hypothetical protein
LGTISAFAYRHRETKKNLCSLPENCWIWGTPFFASQDIPYTNMVVKVIKTWMTLPRHVICMGQIRQTKFLLKDALKNVGMNCYIKTHE